ncbi:MAG: GNAT family N-acetyltransferase [Syntrophobacteraceae bacterium]
MSDRIGKDRGPSEATPSPGGDGPARKPIESMRIRPAYIEDLDVLHGIVRNATRRLDAQGIPQWDEIYPNREILEKDIERQEMCVIEVEGQVAGLIVINEDQPAEYAAVEWACAGRALVVHRLTIAPVHQRCGLASLLMDFAEDTAANEGYNCLRLDAFTLNPAACTLYENRGYRKAGAVCFRKGEFHCYEKATRKERHTQPDRTGRCS